MKTWPGHPENNKPEVNMAENGTEAKMIKITVKTPKEKKDIEVESNSSIEIVRFLFSSTFMSFFEVACSQGCTLCHFLSLGTFSSAPRT